jgi:hypothetical protein
MQGFAARTSARWALEYPMPKFRQLSERQPSKNCVARSQIRRLCIHKGALHFVLFELRGIFVLISISRDPPSSTEAQGTGSSALTSFYYAKNIAYIPHEPILKKLREHKVFAKKLSRALGRGEWSSAKSLETDKPTYRLNHIIKERYALRQLLNSQDAFELLCLPGLHPHRCSPRYR